MKALLDTLEARSDIRANISLLFNRDVRLAYSRSLKDVVCRSLDADALEARYQAYQLTAQLGRVTL